MILRSLKWASFVIVALASVETASAQVNCNMARTQAQKINCLNQMSQIYRQQSDSYNAIARQQWQTYQNVGSVIGYAPIVGRYAQPAWQAPGAYYQYRYGRP